MATGHAHELPMNGTAAIAAARGGDDIARSGAGVERDGAGPAQQVADTPAPRPAGEQEEANRPPHGEEQQKPVEVVELVADEQGGPVSRHLSPPGDFESVERP